VFDGGSNDIIHVIKEDKCDLKVFRNSNLKKLDPDYKTHLRKNLVAFTPWDLVILHGTKPFAEVHLKS
jgi:hypothetical protein